MSPQDTILTRILEALDKAQPSAADWLALEPFRILEYIYTQIDNGRREEADIVHLCGTALPILKKLGV